MATKVRDITDGFCSDKVSDFWPKNVVVFFATLAGFFLLRYLSDLYIDYFDGMKWFMSLERPSLIFSEFCMQHCMLKVCIFLALAVTNIVHFYDTSKIKPLVNAFCFHLFLKFIWYTTFFVMQQCTLGVIMFHFSWISIIFLAIATYCYSRLSALFLLPYLIWDSYFACLLFQICMMN